MLFTFLLVVQFIIAALLVTVILMQKSEGGGLTSGGSPSGLMSARGAANFLTRATAVLATLFITMSILLGVLAAARHSNAIDTSAQRAPVPVTAPSPGALPSLTGNAAAPLVLPGAEPANSTGSSTLGNSAIPLGQ